MRMTVKALVLLWCRAWPTACAVSNSSTAEAIGFVNLDILGRAGRTLGFGIQLFGRNVGSGIQDFSDQFIFPKISDQFLFGQI